MTETTDQLSTATETETADTAPAATPERDAAENLFSTTAALPGPPEVSPDGLWLAYLLDGAHGAAELWLTSLSSEQSHKVDLSFTPVQDTDSDTGRPIRGPQWSPDGRYLALTGLDEDTRSTSIWVVPTPDYAFSGPVAAKVVEATEERPLVDADAPETESSDDASEEVVASNNIADVAEEEALQLPEGVVAEDNEDPGDVVLEPIRLLEHAFSDHSPRWSPDGSSIAFVHQSYGHSSIALVSLSEQSDGTVDLISWSDREESEPVWSRDGKLLAWRRKISGEAGLADILSYDVEKQELKDLTGEKSPAIRHSLEWVPGRNLVAYVTRENDWQSISVVNADNRAGWTVTRESGDKFDVRFSPTEPRFTYIRSEGFSTVAAERGLHASGAVALDPGEGVARYVRWTADKHVVYLFSAPQRPAGFLVQEAKADADRTAIALPKELELAGTGLRHPLPLEYQAGPDERFSGLVYRTQGESGAQPGIVFVDDGPLATRLGEFQLKEQALANTGATVFAPVIHGATGFGHAVANDLSELADHELETNDLAEAGLALINGEQVDAKRLAIVGVGYGGTLALLTAGARPGVYSHVVAVDPVVDWRMEFSGALPTWRSWLTSTYGLPTSSVDRYALRTPTTFAAVIDVPLLLIRTANPPEGRAAQLDMLVAYLEENGVQFELWEAPDEPLAKLLHGLPQRIFG